MIPSTTPKSISRGIFCKEFDTRMKKKQNNKVSFKEDLEVISDQLCEIPPRTFNTFMAIADLDQDGTISDWFNSSVIIKMHSLNSVMVNGGEMIETPVNIVLFDNPKWVQCFFELFFIYYVFNFERDKHPICQCDLSKWNILLVSHRKTSEVTNC